jgi:hypothetical protein
MTAPDKIWIHGYGGNWSPVSGGTQDIEYTLTALSQAQVAAAYEAAAVSATAGLAMGDAGYDVEIPSHIRTLTPADATAAIQAMIDKAVGEERERCAAIARRIGKEYWDTFAEPGHSDEIAEAIEEAKAAATTVRAMGVLLAVEQIDTLHTPATRAAIRKEPKP